MANTIYIDIATTPVTYLPGPEVKHGDHVIFTLGAASATIASATVSFPNGTCLTTSGPYTLGGPTMATAPLTVSATAPKGIYGFEVNIPDEAKDRKVGPQEDDRKNGGIDVTSDPPEL
ncbi:hypothetical protein D7Y13_19380 [Corallococcus praedator]|uniref:IPT/TIG domain-containing protein n=1 Tax=Corallococcus praedator TaxID=2316724 RepID=A0ABX9QFX9_9BACT|nr:MULTISPECIES: hypothetical protein [Corallococcus]RKH36120.1 hypothetical protein D7X75_01585 [Corallococcus sp. CA031C]RKI06812.1 hypothetical protein D7Y13_19380 [Corallococcus praedator]